MASQRPVVVYGASGYTGRLVCEHLTKLRVPFVAAGRDRTRLEAVVRDMRARGADSEARAAEHHPPALRGLFRGARTVINVSGPFSLLGHAVVDAALTEGCHYLDTTGEQDFMLDARYHYGEHFEKASLLLSPSTAFLWGIGTLGAELCLETPGIDAIEAVYAPPSLQTIASLQSMARSFRRMGIELEGGKSVAVKAPDVRRFTLPNGKERRALRVPGGEASFLLGDPRVRACETWFASDDLVRFVPAFDLSRRLSGILPGESLDRFTDDLVQRWKRNPPREEPESGRYQAVTTGRGPAGTVRVVFDGTSPYLLTGILCAEAARLLEEGDAKHHGYASISRAFGAPKLVEILERAGTRTTIERAVAPNVSRIRPRAA